MNKYSAFCYIESIAGKLRKQGRLDEERNHIQHGSVSVLEHSIRVAVISIIISEKLRIRVDRTALARGALLHDYFLYDWHKRGDGTHRLHGFRHPFAAVRKAKEDYRISRKEEWIIRCHMFPLIPIPPVSKEGWIVCIADKISAVHETLFLRKKAAT